MNKINKPSLGGVIPFFVALNIIIVGCSGGSSSSNDSQQSDDNVRGTAAIGAPVSNTEVISNCLNGVGFGKKVVTDANGRFSGEIDDNSFPCAFKLDGHTPETSLHSFSVAPGVVNITPVTDMIIALASNELPSDWYASEDWQNFSTNLNLSINSFVDTLNTNGFSVPVNYEPFSKAFSIGDVADELLDEITDAFSSGADLTYESILSSIADGELSVIPEIENSDDDQNDDQGLCDDSATISPNLVGNNIYEFTSDEAMCFGKNADLSSVKQEVAVELDTEAYANHPDAQYTDLINVSSVGKLTSKVSFGFTTVWLVFEITNVHTSPVCIRLDEAEFVDNLGESLGTISLDHVIGDNYLDTSRRIRNYCIPSGSTRLAWGSSTGALTQGDLEQVDAIKILPDNIYLDSENSLNIPEFLPALEPVSLEWQRNPSDINGDSLVSGNMITFTNNTAGDLSFKDDLVDVLIFDENGYLLDDALGDVSDYLGLDGRAYGDDLIVPALGGSITLHQNTYTSYGPAKKIIVHLELEQ